ncbi:Serine/threonine-protein kinase mos [Holothuria leucospilota]|uniref:non-specific serine/threonine protein kinase n=1 Tax=Holothuria leucospilota TaxID=206669 RepID=A0A9Q1H4R3_HOLLE|nr:Serine/threonine-protein kinase mos [Holothuria leucospilota]
MTKLFQVILRLLTRHLALRRLYIAYLMRFKRSTSVENLVQIEKTESDFRTRRRREYHSDDIATCKLCGNCHNCVYRRNLFVDNTTMPSRFNELDFPEHLSCADNRVNGFFNISAHSEPPCDNNDNFLAKPSPLVSQEFTIEGILGSGGFGSVFLAKYCGSQVAVKNLKKSGQNKRALFQSFRAEFNALYLKHVNIVNVLATSALQDFDEGAFIIMEYAGRRNLQQIINDVHENLAITRRGTFAAQIISGLNFTHSAGIAHLDIKPANIIVNDNDVCKIGDFGCSQLVQNGQGTTSHANRSYLTGTYAYRAPELLRGDAATTRADIYSFGITLWQMLVRETPYARENHHVVIFGVVAHNLRPKFPEFALRNANETWYRETIENSWAANLHDRPTAEDLVNILASHGYENS